MAGLAERLALLGERHVRALSWFIVHAGTVQPWPERFDDGTFLATRAKGIYKPAWSKYALSVRQALGGRYPDQEPTAGPDGSWTYRYFQENVDPGSRDTEFTNVAMLACRDDGVPVGVMRQVSGKPNVRYEVLGVALVSAWEHGYFVLDGFPRAEGDTALIEKQAGVAVAQGAFDPTSVLDARERVTADIVRRRGQVAFRKKLLAAYDGRCAITDCDAEPALEAAHIVPYLGPMTNDPTNGLLLRADVHTLFDLGLVAVETASMSVAVSPSIKGTTYGSLHGRSLRVPQDPGFTPSAKALEQHRQGLRP